MYTFLINPQSQIHEELYLFTELKMALALAFQGEMRTFQNKCVLDELEEGDLVEFPGGPYSHWGLYVSQYLLILCRLELPHSRLITGFVTRLTRRVSLVELITLSEHLSSPLVFSRVRVTRSLVLCVCFVGRCLSFSYIYLMYF